MSAEPHLVRVLKGLKWLDYVSIIYLSRFYFEEGGQWLDGKCGPTTSREFSNSVHPTRVISEGQPKRHALMDT